MPVIELAKLYVQNARDISHTLRGKLLVAKNVMEKSSGYSFNYYQSTEDPDIFFIVGAWPSVEFHIYEFIPGAANQELLESLKDEIAVNWMFHIDADPRRMPHPMGDIEVIAIHRHCVGERYENCLHTTIAASGDELETYTRNGKFIYGGWRVDEDKTNTTHHGTDFILFMGSAEIGKQSKSVGTNKSAEHNRASGSEVEIYHVRPLDIGTVA